MLVNVNFEKTTKDIKLPEIAYNDKQAGIDFYCPEKAIIFAKSFSIVDLKVSWEPSFNPMVGSIISRFFKIYLQMKSKSGLAFKSNIEITNAGVIDEDYRGNIKVLVYNNSEDPFTINEGDKLCQGIVHILPKITINNNATVNKKIRNKKGFGSSNKG